MFHRPRQEDSNKAPEKQPASENVAQGTGKESTSRENTPRQQVPENKPATPAHIDQGTNQDMGSTERHNHNNYSNNDIQTKAEESTMDNDDQNTANETQARPAERPYNAAPNQPVTPPQRPRSFAAGTAPSYPGAAPSSGYTPNENYGGRSNDARKLIIGEGINMSGEIDCCDHLIVEGSVEASLKGANLLEISESGVFYGTVEIDEATIAGRFEGDLVVNGRLTIRSTGSVTGTITYKEFAVEAGAMIDGKISPIGAQAGAKKPTKESGKSKSSARNDNGGSELPFAGSAASSVEAAE